MKKIAKSVKVGDVVQFPCIQFDERRSGWNGWLFRAAIVNRVYTSAKGIRCANVTYCTKRAGRYQLLPNVEKNVNVKCSCLFEYNLAKAARDYKEFKSYEDAGEQVCWDEDTALLVSHNLI